MAHALPRLCFYGFNGEDITSELNTHGACYESRHLFSADAPWVVVELFEFGLPALAGVLVGWAKARASRQIKLVLKDGTQIEAKGMSAKELSEHLKVAVAADLHQPRPGAEEKE